MWFFISKKTVSKQYQFGYKPKVRLFSPATGKVLASLHHVCEVCWLSSWFRAVGKSMDLLAPPPPQASYLTCSRVPGIGYKRSTFQISDTPATRILAGRPDLSELYLGLEM